MIESSGRGEPAQYSGPGKSTASVVVTGWGIVSAHGCGVEPVRLALAEGRAVLSEIDRGAGYHRQRGAGLGALVDADCYSSILSPIKARRMSPPSRLAIVAAHLAVAQSGWAADFGGAKERIHEADDSFRGTSRAESTAVVLGTSFGPSSYTERILRQILLESPQAASPMLFTESVANAPAAQVALAWECRGPNITITQREASALLAVAEGAELIRAGRARRALVGGVEELNPLLHAVLDRFGALAGSRGGSKERSEVARPFDRRRNGYNAAEGAAVLTLECESEARARGARILARVGPCARAFDPRAPVTGWSRDGSEIAADLLDGIERGGWPGQPDVWVSGASGHRQGDRFEASLLRSARSRFGGCPVIAPKAVLGEQGIAMLAAALILLDGGAVATPSDFQVDPELGIALERAVTGGGRLLLSAAAAGGSCCWLGLESG